MSRLSRRHDKLLRRYLEIARERAEVAEHGHSRWHLARLAVRERALAGAVRRVRLELGLPERFDAEAETLRLDSRRNRFRRGPAFHHRSQDSELFGPERQRVKPIPELRVSQPAIAGSSVDLTGELVAHAARFCARRAAEELLQQRASRSRGDVDGPIAAWPARPLARTASGAIYAGSAGRLMGELVGRAADSDEAAEHVRVAVCSYVAEFTAFVVAALYRERDAAAHVGVRSKVEHMAGVADLRQALEHAACERIAVEARATRGGRDLSVADIAALVGVRLPASNRHRLRHQP